MTHIRITCGCNTVQDPKIFSTVKEAEDHAAATGHKLHGQITVEK